MRSIYLSHTGLTEPLGHSQVVPYLQGLARAGWEIEVIGFEPAGTAVEKVQALIERDLTPSGIRYSWRARSVSHAMAVKAKEMTRAILTAIARAAARRTRIVHARSYLPAAVGTAIRALLPGSRFIFDCRGLLGDEYADFGHWSRGSVRYRALKRFEKHFFTHADAVVVLTDRLRRWLKNEARYSDERRPVEVIPCCVDLERFRPDAQARTAARARLEVGDRFVLAYAGNLGSWYSETEMAQLFAAIRRRRDARFLVLTRADSGPLLAALGQQGIGDDTVIVRSAQPAEVPQLLAAADAAVSFAQPQFSKIASSPVKMAEYLALGLPMVTNRGIGDFDELAGSPALVVADSLDAGSMDRAAERLLALDSKVAPAAARQLAETRFCLERVGIHRYRELYARLGS